MIIYTIGFTQKTAQRFFEIIQNNGIKLVIDIRLNNASQLAGFSKGNDLKYFLSKICGCDYTHRVDFAPTKEILDGYKGKIITWPEYEMQYTSLIYNRGSLGGFIEKYNKYQKVCLLCSEPTEANCHRRLFAEMLAKEYQQITIKHI
ncbi:MAG: DUF488 domain-containing protein [Clostridiales bacterium]|jgi:uncharacterized protein (DUF488 family)|nr:DUF488 domain-containing protein [Clostridiales bacterium]MDR2713767.1 DUF488 domain-containing protein [Clostridiales bacterium]